MNRDSIKKKFMIVRNRCERIGRIVKYSLRGEAELSILDFIKKYEKFPIFLEEIALAYQTVISNDGNNVDKAGGDVNKIAINKKGNIILGKAYLANSIYREERFVLVERVNEKVSVIPQGQRKDIQNLSNLQKEVQGKLLAIRYKEESKVFGNECFYQSLEKYKIQGKRNTTHRIEIYGLKEILTKDMSVMDIGCNCGFFDLTIAPMVKSVLGLEYDGDYLTYAEEYRKLLDIENVSFVCGDFKQFNTDKKVNMIFSFAVHKWIGLPLREYFLKLHGLLENNGQILFETHGLHSYDKGIEEKIGGYIDGLFKIEKEGMANDGWKGDRKFYIMKKVNN